jgi:hypothetical protein
VVLEKLHDHCSPSICPSRDCPWAKGRVRGPVFLRKDLVKTHSGNQVSLLVAIGCNYEKGGVVKTKIFGAETTRFEEATDAWLREIQNLGEIKHVGIALNHNSTWVNMVILYEPGKQEVEPIGMIFNGDGEDEKTM